MSKFKLSFDQGFAIMGFLSLIILGILGYTFYYIYSTDVNSFKTINQPTLTKPIRNIIS